MASRDLTSEELLGALDDVRAYPRLAVDRAVAVMKAQRDDAWRNLDMVHDDIAALLVAAGLGDHARPISTHEVVQRELLPWIEERRFFVNAVPNGPSIDEALVQERLAALHAGEPEGYHNPRDAIDGGHGER